MDRQEGYYWVKYDGKYLTGYCYRCGMGYNVWKLPTVIDDSIIKDSNLEHINENRIKEPGELPD